MPGHLRTGYNDRQPVCEACPIGTFYVGGWFGCERCKKGMTTVTVASTSKYNCCKFSTIRIREILTFSGLP